MDEEQWYSVRVFALLMHKMHIYFPKPIYCDLGFELRKMIQLFFLMSPVEAILPILRQPLDVRPKPIHVSWIRKECGNNKHSYKAAPYSQPDSSSSSGKYVKSSFWWSRSMALWATVILKGCTKAIASRVDFWLSSTSNCTWKRWEKAQ